MATGPDSWKLSERLFKRFLIYRVAQDTDMVWPAFFNSNLRGTHWLRRRQLGQNVIPIGGCLDIEPVPRLRQAQRHSLLVVCHDCHGGNLPLVWPNIKRFPATTPQYRHGQMLNSGNRGKTAKFADSPIPTCQTSDF
jgi:hypothetical protein